MLHVPCIIHLSYIHKLPPPGPSNVFRELLTQQGLHGSLDGVHRISRPVDAGCHIGQTRTLAHFIDILLTTDAKSYITISELFELKAIMELPGVLVISSTAVPATLALTSP